METGKTILIVIGVFILLIFVFAVAGKIVTFNAIFQDEGEYKARPVDGVISTTSRNDREIVDNEEIANDEEPETITRSSSGSNSNNVNQQNPEVINQEETENNPQINEGPTRIGSATVSAGSSSIVNIET